MMQRPFSTENHKKKTVQQLLQELRNPKRNISVKSKVHKPELDVESIRAQMKKKWRDPGYCNVQFKKPPILRAKILNEWEYSRIFLAERSYKYPKNYKGYKFDQSSREFVRPDKSLLSEAFRKFLQKNESIRANEESCHFESENELKEKRGKIIRMLTENSTRSKMKKETTRDGFFGTTKRSNKLKTINI